MTRYTGPQIKAACIAAGFPADKARIMAAVALGESGGDTNATANTSREYSVGVFQIEIRTYHTDVPEWCARDLGCAASQALRISSNGTNFQPWTVYRTGAYMAHLAEVDNGESPAPPPPDTVTPTTAIGGEPINIPGLGAIYLPTADEWKRAGIVFTVAGLALFSIVAGLYQWAGTK